MRKSVMKITYYIVHNSPSSFATISGGSWVAGGVGSREAPCSGCSGDAQVHSLEGCGNRCWCLALVVQTLRTHALILGEKLGRFYDEKQMNRLTKCPVWLTGVEGSTCWCTWTLDAPCWSVRSKKEIRIGILRTKIINWLTLYWGWTTLGSGWCSWYSWALCWIPAWSLHWSHELQALTTLKSGLLLSTLLCHRSPTWRKLHLWKGWNKLLICAKSHLWQRRAW